MALQLILGNAGAGKSHYIFEKIIQESMEHPTKQYLIIVPEQFTMQTQKDLVMMHPRHGIMNIDVLSFERLAQRVFSEVGGEHRKILEDTGKSLVLRKLAEEKKDELTLLGGSLRKLGYISEVKSLLSEFVQYRIEPEDLTQIMEQNKSNPQLAKSQRWHMASHISDSRGAVESAGGYGGAVTVSSEQCDRSGWLPWLHAYPAGADRKIADAYG